MHLSEEQITAMSDHERAALIARLTSKAPQLPAPKSVRRARKVRLSLMTVGSAALIPWIIYLALTLPNDYTAPNWRLTWVGFDILLVSCMAATAFLGWQRRPQTMFPAFATGVLLLSDAWFDLTTSSAQDRPAAFASALLLEIPVALLLIIGSWRILAVLLNASEWIVPLWRRRIAQDNHPAGRRRRTRGSSLASTSSEDPLV